MNFAFAKPNECNFSVVCGFYGNWVPETRNHYVTVHSKKVLITPVSINAIFGMSEDTEP